MAKSKSNKGASDLAAVLQKRMVKTANRATGVCVETGEVMEGRKLKLASLPGALLDTDDYSVCASLQTKMPCQSSYPFGSGDQVLVVWTFDGEPVVVDKIVRANSGNALTDCSWQHTCQGLANAVKRIGNLENKVSSLENSVDGISGDIGTINSDIDEVNEKISKIDEDITNLERDISNLETRVEGLG